MSSDVMRVRLHLRGVRVLEVVADSVACHRFLLSRRFESDARR